MFWLLCPEDARRGAEALILSCWPVPHPSAAHLVNDVGHEERPLPAKPAEVAAPAVEERAGPKRL